MAARIENISFFADDAPDLAVAVKNSAGAVVNIAGATITWSLAPNNTVVATLTKTVGAGITITDAANGLFTVALDSANTLNLAGTYYHECALTLGGRKRTIFYGACEIKRSIA